MSEKRFPILGHKNLKSVPWSLLEPHRKQAMKNHGQTLERLAERGGLDLSEMLAICTGNRWHDLFTLTTPKEPTP